MSKELLTILFSLGALCASFSATAQTEKATTQATGEGDGAELEDPTETQFDQARAVETESSEDEASGGEGGPSEAETVNAPVVPLQLSPAEAMQLAADVETHHGVLAYADHLFMDGDWYRAIGEYRRYLYLMRGRGPHSPRAAIAIGEALLRGQQLDAAGRQLDGVAQRTSDLYLRRVALFGAARAYLLDGRPELAKPRFRLLAEDEETAAPMRREATWLLAWGHFDAGEFEQAEETFGLLSESEGLHQEEAAAVIVELKKRSSLSQRNPLVAGALSLIPGLGHIYLGQWSVGLTSFGWNALFTFAAVTAWLQGQWGVALVLTVMELSWYSGGIFGALAGTLRYNRDVKRNWRDQILADFGASRDMPGMYIYPDRIKNPPGTAHRFGVPVSSTSILPVVEPTP